MADTSIGGRFRGAGASFQSATIHFQLPSGIELRGGWNDVSTTGPTTVIVTVNSQTLDVQFTPAVLIDVQFPLQNVYWGGLTWNFATGTVSGCRLDYGYGLNPSYRTVSLHDYFGSQISSAFSAMIKNTPFANRGYNPIGDRNIQQTLQRVKQNVTAGPPSGNVTLRNLTGLGGSVSLVVNQHIQKSTPEGGIWIWPETKVRITAELSGNAQDVKDDGVRVSSVVIDGEEGIYVTKGGERVIELKKICIRRGGTIRVQHHEPISNGAKGLYAGEAWGRLLGYSASGNDPGRKLTDPIVSKIEKALSDSLAEMYRQHYRTIQSHMPGGAKLDDVFGISPRGTLNRKSLGG